ncbi:MAG: serine/threonine protein kinase [Polyangiaceae bacterium]|nr:serine/threonine protein kinase [Polyangiaceae bacterium]
MSADQAEAPDAPAAPAGGDSAESLSGVVTMPLVSVSVPPLPRDDFDARYTLAEVLGRGGMGDVFVARDGRIGREVALKAARFDGGEDVMTRFNRECRLQGQLEHPGVVPVYEAGDMADGAPFFTMKRIRGDSLESIVRALGRADPKMSARFTRARLLAAFVTVCQTMCFAHRRGVVHRDLKPANVMLGDFGEVYVIDWGIAKVRSASQSAVPSARKVERPDLDDQPTYSTLHGEVLGTLGYMAPEQLHDARHADERSDVYSLGAMLFELLTYERLHPSEKAVELAESTVKPVEARIRSIMRAKSLAPELEEACVRATAQEVGDRFDSVEGLLGAVQRFLDGDRDVEARAKLADVEARLALRALGGIEERPVSREVALEHAGRALALAPSHALAQEVVLKLMLEEPKRGEEPAEVAREVERVALLVYRRGAVAGALLYAMWLPLIAILALSKPMQPSALLVWAVLDLIAIGVLLFCSRVRRRTAPLQFLALVFCLLATDSASRVVGPFITVPGVITLTTVVFMLLGRERWQLPTATLGALALIAPYALELTGVLTPTTTFSVGEMRTASPVVALDPASTAFALAAGTVILFGVLCLAAIYFQRVLLANTRKTAIQKWRLAGLVPRGVIDGPTSSLRARQ